MLSRQRITSHIRVKCERPPELTGCMVLQVIIGALIVINPNDEHCALYLQEAVRLLLSGHIGHPK